MHLLVQITEILLKFLSKEEQVIKIITENVMIMVASYGTNGNKVFIIASRRQT